MVRPSARWAVISSSVISTAVARGSAPPLLGRATVFTPRLHDPVSVPKNNAPYCSEVALRQPMVCRQSNGIEPELTCRPLAPSVHVWRLIAVEAVKEISERTRNVRDRRHLPANVASPIHCLASVYCAACPCVADRWLRTAPTPPPRPSTAPPPHPPTAPSPRARPRAVPAPRAPSLAPASPSAA